MLTVNKYINEHFDKSFIKVNTFFAVVPISLIKKPERNIHIYVNYKGLNNVTDKNQYLIPLIRKTLSILYYARFFIKFDIIMAFNRLRIVFSNE